MAYSTNCFFGEGGGRAGTRKSKGGKAGAEEKVLGSGPLVLGKQERKRGKRRSWVLGPGFWEEQKQVKQETSFLEARLRGQAKAEKQDRSSCSSLLFPALLCSS
ncbi:hypothetical protein BOO91_19830 [Vibrio navarrensis]|nr:hypothetical protein [Vibrio navarrensis]